MARFGDVFDCPLCGKLIEPPHVKRHLAAHAHDARAPHARRGRTVEGSVRYRVGAVAGAARGDRERSRQRDGHADRGTSVNGQRTKLQCRVRVGAPIVIVEGVDRLWHLAPAADLRETGTVRTLCGLTGETYLFGVLMVERHACGVCSKRVPHDHPALAKRRRRGGGRPKGSSRISEAQLRALYALHRDQRVPLNEIARRYWQKLGYPSHRACSASLFSMMKRRGMKLHDRIEMVKVASTRHGLAPKHGPRPGYGPYKRKVLGGREDRPQCVATKQQAPGKGRRCNARAQGGSSYCYGHDPARKADRDRHLEAMRARQPKPELVPWLEVRAELWPWLARHEYPASRLAEATGVAQATCSRLLKDCRSTVTRALAVRLLVVVERAIDEAA